jgi:hypothetical protein
MISGFSFRFLSGPDGTVVLWLRAGQADELGPLTLSVDQATELGELLDRLMALVTTAHEAQSVHAIPVRPSYVRPAGSSDDEEDGER